MKLDSRIILSLFVLMLMAACASVRQGAPVVRHNGVLQFVVNLSNPSTHDISGVHQAALTTEQVRKLKHPQGALYAVTSLGIVPVELSDANGNGRLDALVVEALIPAGGAVAVPVYAGNPGDVEFVKKTQAELWHRTTGNWRNGVYRGGGNFFRFDSLRVPDGFTDHTYFIKYEGPGWESDKVGYRMYLDWRNANDVFGKKITDMVLQDVGVDGFETYHHMADWGMDVLKVGRSLGIGSIAWFDGEKAVRVEKTDSVMCKIEADGLIRSQVKTWYYGWQLGETKNNLISLKTIDAGSRMTRELLTFDTPQQNVATGFIIEKGIDMFEMTSANGKWRAMASWGEQSLAGDRMGLAILFPAHQNGRVTADRLSHLVVFEKPLTSVEYYFLAAWEQEPGGVTTLEAFRTYLQQSLDALENPVQASVE